MDGADNGPPSVSHVAHDSHHNICRPGIQACTSPHVSFALTMPGLEAQAWQSSASLKNTCLQPASPDPPVETEFSQKQETSSSGYAGCYQGFHKGAHSHVMATSRYLRFCACEILTIFKIVLATPCIWASLRQ